MGEVACWTVATGNVAVNMRKSRKAAQFFIKQEGFKGVYIAPDGSGALWLYDSENNAKIAKNKAKIAGIHTGYNICQCFVDDKYLNSEGDSK